MGDRKPRSYAILKSFYWKPRPWRTKAVNGRTLESVVRTLKVLNGSKLFETNQRNNSRKRLRFKVPTFPFLKRNVTQSLDNWPVYEQRLIEYNERKLSLASQQIVTQKDDKHVDNNEEECEDVNVEDDSEDEVQEKASCSSHAEPIVEEPISQQRASVNKENEVQDEDARSDISAPTTSKGLKRWPNTIYLDSTILETPKSNSSFDKVRSLPLADCSPIIREMKEDETEVFSNTLPLTSTPAFVPDRTPMLLKKMRIDAAQNKRLENRRTSKRTGLPAETPAKRPKRAF
ncbi:unnamed protein product [Bursaphelenchus okinawaensis]|uniref:Uncharacterized protein n=1 Tax=Bursaphelenchus okinawaensis TaxID=465554 RepID=A0A811K8I0_9BILA|nr:unnamed protein product [Bursaphelenchus okinawaensis]CAG9095009.1 unnamed protein product [Bursaphelenchus okinawaensis]